MTTEKRIELAAIFAARYIQESHDIHADAYKRAQVCRAAAWLGVELDDAANTSNGPCICRADSRTRAWVIPTNEELMIARHTRDLLAAP